MPNSTIWVRFGPVESQSKGLPFSSDITCAEFLRTVRSAALRDVDGMCKRIEAEFRADYAETARELSQHALELQYIEQARDEQVLTRKHEEATAEGGSTDLTSLTEAPEPKDESIEIARKLVDGLERRQYALERRVMAVRAMHTASVQLRHDTQASNRSAREGHGVSDAMRARSIDAADLAASLLRMADGVDELDGRQMGGAGNLSPGVAGAGPPELASAVERLRASTAEEQARWRDWLGVDLCETGPALEAVLRAGVAGTEWAPHVEGGGPDGGVVGGGGGGGGEASALDCGSGTTADGPAARQIPDPEASVPTLGLSLPENRGRRVGELLTPGGCYCLAVVPGEVLPPRVPSRLRTRSQARTGTARGGTTRGTTRGGAAGGGATTRGTSSADASAPHAPILRAGQAFPLLLVFPPRLPLSRVAEAVAAPEPTAEPSVEAEGKGKGGKGKGGKPSGKKSPRPSDDAGVGKGVGDAPPPPAETLDDVASGWGPLVQVAKQAVLAWLRGADTVTSDESDGKAKKKKK